MRTCVNCEVWIHDYYLYILSCLRGGFTVQIENDDCNNNITAKLWKLTNVVIYKYRNLFICSKKFVKKWRARSVVKCITFDSKLLLKSESRWKESVDDINFLMLVVESPEKVSRTFHRPGAQSQQGLVPSNNQTR